MAHIKLRHFVASDPNRHLKYRKRVRMLRAVRSSRKNELFYKSQLREIVKKLRDTTRKNLLPALKTLLQAQGSDSRARDMDVTETVKRQINQMARSFGGIEQTAQRLARMAVERNLAAVDAGLVSSVKSSVGIDISGALSGQGEIQEAMRLYTKANIDLITSIPERYFDKLEAAVVDNFEAGMRFEDLAEIVEHIGDVTESRANLIARDQTSKMNGSFNEVRQTSLGIEEYEWQTSGDERVRDEHIANDGLRFRWDSPPPTGHPGEDIQCRCVAIPVFNLDEEEQTWLGDNPPSDDE